MKLYFTLHRQGANWVSVQHAEDCNYENLMHYSVKTKKDAINTLLEEHPGDEVYIDNIPAIDILRKK